MKIIVIGAGVLGASAAYHLSVRGAEVTVLDRQAPAAGATQGAFAMLISAQEAGPRWLHELYATAVGDWRRLDAELPGAFDIQWGGALNWTPPGVEAEQTAATTRTLQTWGSPVRPLTPAMIAALAPGVEPGPFGAGLFLPDFGAVDPARVLAALRQAGAAQGAIYAPACAVIDLKRDGEIATVVTDHGDWTADALVLAGGAGSTVLAAHVTQSLPLRIVSGVLAYSKPLPRMLDRVLNSPLGAVKQDAQGRIVTGLAYAPDAAVIDTTRDYGRRLLANAASVLPAIAGAELERMTVGHVPIPIDGRPVCGFLGDASRGAGLYALTSMSGITFAPLLGRFAATEILDGLSIAALENCRPSRFNA